MNTKSNQIEEIFDGQTKIYSKRNSIAVMGQGKITALVLGPDIPPTVKRVSFVKGQNQLEEEIIGKLQ